MLQTECNFRHLEFYLSKVSMAVEVPVSVGRGKLGLGGWVGGWVGGVCVCVCVCVKLSPWI